ncbi:hypothetical protein SUREIYA_00400 [Serratia phage vB_SmaM-Sureiya]|nr:hypothetical protein SUREIYA_00400 [Serratia phage vB_SmaM-Sureiya]
MSITISLLISLLIGFGCGCVTKGLLTKRKERKEEALRAKELLKETELPPKALLNSIGVHLYAVCSIKQLRTYDECLEFIEEQLNWYLPLAKELTWTTHNVGFNKLEAIVKYKGATMKVEIELTKSKRNI